MSARASSVSRTAAPSSASVNGLLSLADSSDNAHSQALRITTERAASLIVTTDEVMAEYLTFFAAAPETLRRQVLQAFGGFWRALSFA